MARDWRSTQRTPLGEAVLRLAMLAGELEAAAPGDSYLIGSDTTKEVAKDLRRVLRATRG